LQVTLEIDLSFMREALAEALRAEEGGEVPVGAVVVCNGEIIGRGGNRNIADHDPTAHAEIVAMKAAASNIQNYRLENCTLYVTVEPCSMCAGAAVQARIARLVYGCRDEKAGAVESLFRIANDVRLNHQIAITSGILQEECSSILKNFFRKKRAKE
jgi:tRNA(adenine34) deaminase